MARWQLAPIALLLLAGPASAECTNDVCVSLQKILAARSGSFAKLKGKPTVDTRGDAVWQSPRLSHLGSEDHGISTQQQRVRLWQRRSGEDIGDFPRNHGCDVAV